MKGFAPELPASNQEREPATHPIEKKEQNGTQPLKYTLAVLVTLAIAIGFLVASTSVDHILLENLFIACTIVFSVVALKVSSTLK